MNAAECLARTIAATCAALSLGILARGAPDAQAPSGADLQDLLRYAEPMCGTAGGANTFPGATAPFGMIQWSPDTETGKRDGGYDARDKRISGFSVDHLSGAGCSWGENFQMMPLLAAGAASPAMDRTAFAAAFSHDHEAATPGYYSVTLDNGIKVEMTATTRTGFGRFTFPAQGDAVMAINAASGINAISSSSIRIDPDRREVTGQVTGGHFCRSGGLTTLYFCAVFDHAISAESVWNGRALTPGGTQAEGAHTGAFITFDTSGGRTVLAKIAISYVSVDGARANLAAENPVTAFSSENFNKAVLAEGSTWNELLNRIQVNGGSEADKETFYSMLYHALVAPNVCSDADGRYRGYDGDVHEASGYTQYANFSGWDIYRCECQLLAMLVPERAGDMAQSLFADFQEGGAFPRWGVPNIDSGVMMGDPAAPIIADFYGFGATNFDAKAALQGLVLAATQPTVRAPRSRTNERDALADYLRLGYVPEHHQGGSGSVAMTLEYASADFALSQFAKALGDDEDSELCLAHAQGWKKLYNPATGYLQMRREDGSWAPGFANNLERYDGVRAYVEGTAGQYTWMVPFDLKNLAGLMGGPDKAAARLDAFFTKLNVGVRGPDSWMAYMGNEPCLETPWIYDFFEKPWETQRVVRRVMTELYSARYNGFPGNDDLGAMSSWYVFGALGMYPELPGSDVLVLGSPLFPEAVIHLRGGDVAIGGAGAGDDAPYVRALKVNGQVSEKPWIRFAEISRGGTLDYELGSAPDKAWGSDAADAPPSYSGAPAASAP